MHHHSRLFYKSLTCTHPRRLFSISKARCLQYPDPPTTEHSDRESFFRYASRAQLSKNSTVYQGTLYEYTVQEALQKIGIDTKRYGAANDGGIDLLGVWKLPTIPTPLRLFIQCKRLATPASPVLLRELIGSFGGAPTGWNEPGVLGLLVTSESSTAQSRALLQKSSHPVGHLRCSENGELLQITWNRQTDDLGLAGISTHQTYTATGGTDLRLMWQGDFLSKQLSNVDDKTI